MINTNKETSHKYNFYFPDSLKQEVASSLDKLFTATGTANPLHSKGSVSALIRYLLTDFVATPTDVLVKRDVHKIVQDFYVSANYSYIDHKTKQKITKEGVSCQ